jgi:hypothetical protein
MLDLKCEVGVLLNSYANRINKVDKNDFKEQDRLEELYAKAIILNVKYGYGLFYPIDDFIEDVRCGGIMNYDGIGYLLDVDGNELGSVNCNVKFLEDAKKNGAVYVSWFNK